MSFLRPMVRGVQEERAAASLPKNAQQRHCWTGEERPLPPQPDTDDEIEIDIDATQTASAEERLRTLDFEQMSMAEMAAAKADAGEAVPACAAGTQPPDRALAGTLPDWQATMRNAMRKGGEVTDFATKRRKLTISQSCGALRYLRLDVAILARGFAFSACGGQPARARAGRRSMPLPLAPG